MTNVIHATFTPRSDTVMPGGDIVDHPTRHEAEQPLTEYQRWRRILAAPTTVACPRCNAWPGLPCQSSGGYNTADHAARKALVDTWTDDEKLAAYAARKTAERRRREAGEAERVRLEADPAWRAYRDRVAAQVADVIAEANRLAKQDMRDEAPDCRDGWLHANPSCRCKITGVRT